MDVTGAGYSIDGAAASNITTSAGDLTIGGGTQAGAVTIQSAEADAAAIFLNASNGAGGIDIDAGSAGIAMDVTGAGYSIDGAAASNITTSAGDLTIGGGTQAGAVTIQSAEADAAAIFLNASNVAGGIDIDAGSAGIAMDAANITITPTTLTTNVGDMTIQGIADAEAELFLESDAAADDDDKWRIQATAETGVLAIANKVSGAYVDKLTIDAATGVVSSTAGFSGPMASSSLTSDANVTVQSNNNNAGAILITAAADPGGDAAITINNTLGTSVTEGTAAIQLKALAGGINIKADVANASAVRLNASAGGMQINANDA
ncbi:uncharacterized protein METZ01_LOCUS242052, partial [marine metagenome]